MEASAGQVVQNKVGVRSFCVRVAAAFILVGQRYMSRRQGTLGYLTLAIAVAEDVIPQQMKHNTSTQRHRPYETIQPQHKHQHDGRGDNVHFRQFKHNWVNLISIFVMVRCS